MTTIQIPKRRIKFGSSAKSVVPAFAILPHPVPAASFAFFAKRTSYSTASERLGLEYSYFDSPAFDNVSGTERDSITTSWIDKRDATAYCRFHSVSLPTPLQWQSFVELVVLEDLFKLERDEDKNGIFFSSYEWLKSSRPILIGRPPLVGLQDGEKAALPTPDMWTTARSQAPQMSLTFRFVTG